MADIYLGEITLTPKQIERLAEVDDNSINGFKYKGGGLSVNHKSETLSDAEKASILNMVNTIPDLEPTKSKDKKQKRDAVLQKLGVTMEEFKDLMRGM